MEEKSDSGREGRLERVRADNGISKEAMELSRSWIRIMLHVKALKEVLKSCTFTNAAEADKFAQKLFELERLDNLHAKKAARLLKLNKKKYLDEVMSLKALYHYPWIEARVKMTRSDKPKEPEHQVEEGYGKVTKRNRKVRTDDVMEGF